MPVTNVKQIERFAALSGQRSPKILLRFILAHDPTTSRNWESVAGDVPEAPAKLRLHFTPHRSTATADLRRTRIAGCRPASPPDPISRRPHALACQNAAMDLDGSHLMLASSAVVLAAVVGSASPARPGSPGLLLYLGLGLCWCGVPGQNRPDRRNWPR
jgi:hypothetical protein